MSAVRQDGATMDLIALRASDDLGVNAVANLPKSAQWAALEVLIISLGLRPLTQVDVPAEKLKAFRKESE